MISVLNDGSIEINIFIYEINRKMNRWTFERFMRFYEKKYSRVTINRSLFRKAHVDFFSYLIINVHFFFLLLGEHLLSHIIPVYDVSMNNYV